MTHDDHRTRPGKTDSVPSYFKPLRRKIGVATLMLACLFAAGWVRSQSHFDAIVFSDDAGKTVFYLVSEDQRIIVDMNPSLTSWRTPILNSQRLRKGAFQVEDGLKWYWHLWGLSYGGYPASGTRFLNVQYWLIVIPLVLLSTWLLLSKLRQPKTVEEQG